MYTVSPGARYGRYTHTHPAAMSASAKAADAPTVRPSVRPDPYAARHFVSHAEEQCATVRARNSCQKHNHIRHGVCDRYICMVCDSPTLAGGTRMASSRNDHSPHAARSLLSLHIHLPSAAASRYVLHKLARMRRRRFERKNLPSAQNQRPLAPFHAWNRRGAHVDRYIPYVGIQPTQQRPPVCNVPQFQSGSGSRDCAAE